MASDHLISLPSLRASEEGRKRETTSPTARSGTPRSSSTLLPFREVLHQYTSFIPVPPLFQGHLPREATPNQSGPGTCSSSEHLKRVSLYPISFKYISQTLLKALRGMLDGGEVKG